MSERSRSALPLSVVGAALLAAAGLVSVFTDESDQWAWGAMILTSLVGLAALVIAGGVALLRRRPARR